MVYDVSDLMREVRVALDLNNSSETLIESGDIDTLTLDEIIRQKLPIAARIIENETPHHLLDSGKPFAATIGWRGDVGVGSGIVKLPDDFLRLVSFQMSDWSYPVTVAITEESPLYAQQHSRYAGLRGTPQKPIVAITQHPTGLHLEFFSCKAGSTVTLNRARYIAMPQIINGSITLCEKLYHAIVHYTGYLVAVTVGDADRAKSLLETSKSLMNQ